MKNLSAPVIAVAIAGALAAAYPAASWYTGKRIEVTMTELAQQSIKSPYVKIVKQDFQRGVFSSTEDTIIEITSPFPKTPDPAAADGGAASETSKPLQLHFVSHIQHGPFPGARFGSATINTELVLDGNDKAEAEKVFGKQAPVQILTKLGYMGGGSVEASSPAFAFGPDGDKIDWKGIKFNADFTGGGKDVQYKLDAPGLTAHTKEGMDVVIGAISGVGDSQRVGDSALHLGKSNFVVDQLKMTNANEPAKSFDMQKLSLQSNSSAKNGFVDLAIQLGAKSVNINKLALNDIHYDYSLHHLDQQALTKLVDAINNRPANQSQSMEEMTASMVQIWKEFGPAILNNKPELTIDRMSVSTPDGEAKLSAKATLGEAVTADFDNLMALLPKLEASASLSVPEPLLLKVMSSSVSDPDTQTQMQEGAKQRIAALEAQGFVIRKDTILSTSFDWKQGKALINGKPMM